MLVNDQRAIKLCSLMLFSPLDKNNLHLINILMIMHNFTEIRLYQIVSSKLNRAISP